MEPEHAPGAATDGGATHDAAAAARILEHVGDYLFSTEMLPDGTVRPVWESPNTRELFGGETDRGPDVAATLARMVHADDLAAFQRFHADASSGRPAEAELRLVGADGRTRWVWMRGRPRREHGRLFVDGIVSNVTERRRLAEELAESRALLRAMLDNSDAVIFAKDRAGRYLFVNRAQTEVIGRPAEEVVGRTDQELFGPGTADVFAANDWAVMLSGRPTRIEEHVPTPAGERVYLSTKFPLLTASGTTRGVCGIAIDITERERAAEAQRRLLAHERETVERLRELDRMKDEFVAVATHELRTPLTSIVGYLELLAEHQDGMSDMQRGFLATIARNADRLSRLVSDLLDLSRVVDGSVPVDVGPMSLSALARDAVEAIRPAALDARIAVTADIERDLHIEGDPARLRQVLDNLLSNALKFTPAGGGVHVCVAGAPAVARLTVADTGIGIPAAERELLFERFYRTSAVLERQIPGTGLGLAIARAIVQAHGGSISAVANEPAGTVFQVELPRRGPAALSGLA